MSLKAALDGAAGPAIIAEIKRASPSKGDLALGWDPVELARIYQDHGAAAISVLTEVPYFKGDPEFIRRMRPVMHLPILRKDFILEPIQVYETAALGADALLLIVSLLELGQLRALLLLTRSLGLEALVEVHTAAEMETALTAGARLIGINSSESPHLRDVSGPGPGVGPPGAAGSDPGGRLGPQDPGRPGTL